MYKHCYWRNITNARKTWLYQPWHDGIILKEPYDLKDQQIAQNANPNKQSKTLKRTRLDAKFFKSEYFKTEFAKINQSVINRELEKLFSSQGAKNNFESRSWEIFTLRKSLIISKSTLAQQILLIQLLQKNLVVTCRNLLVSCKISQINFPSKYQPLLRFRNIFTSKNQGKLVTMLILSYWKMWTLTYASSFSLNDI